MPPSTVGPPFDQFMATAEAVARARPEVDLEMAREVFREVATLLHNGLALDGLDGHDARAVVAGLCVDLVAEDPGGAVRARSQATLEGPGDLHDPEGVSAAYLVAVALLQLVERNGTPRHALTSGDRGGRLRRAGRSVPAVAGLEAGGAAGGAVAALDVAQAPLDLGDRVVLPVRAG